MFAQQEEQPDEPAPAPAFERPQGPQLTPDFILAISRKPGRKVVLAGRFNDPLLDVIPKKSGGFVYHFLVAARRRDRVPAQTTVEGNKTLQVVPIERVLDYVRARIEDESRAFNRPQSIDEYGDNEDFPLIKQQK